MNLILFEPAETERPLPRNDRRAVHILDVLRRQPGESFDVGLINGPRGRATLHTIGTDALTLSFDWGSAPPDVEALTLIVGLPRPQTARDILREATTLGIGAMHFVATEKSEPSYARSTLWTSGEWRRLLITGAEQAFATGIPSVTIGHPLTTALAAIPADAVRLALDNYESPAPLGSITALPGRHHVLAIGAERGWSPRERDALRVQRFTFVHLGSRVLRTETAVIAALSILRAKLGLM